MQRGPSRATDAKGPPWHHRRRTGSSGWSACLSTQSCLTLCDPVDCSPPGSSVHSILQARILQRVATASSSGSSQPRDRTRISYGSHVAGGFFTAEPLAKPLREECAQGKEEDSDGRRQGLRIKGKGCRLNTGQVMDGAEMERL